MVVRCSWQRQQLSQSSKIHHLPQLDLLQLQLQDNGQAVQIDPQLNNVPLPKEGELVYSQQAIYHYLAKGQG